MAARRFIFPLQTVLEQRERAEQEEQRKVAELERERLSVEDRLRGYQQQIMGAKQEMREYLGSGPGGGGGGGGGISAAVQLASVRMQAGASLHLVAKAQQTVFELAGVHRRLEMARRELLKATAARKAVALLKERQFAEWKQAINKREALELDEMSVMRHGRRDTGLGGEPEANE